MVLGTLGPGFRSSSCFTGRVPDFSVALGDVLGVRSGIGGAYGTAFESRWGRDVGA